MEPETLVAATDYLLAVVAFLGAFRLDRARKSPGRLSLRLWTAGFAAIGSAALFGGAWHHFSRGLVEPAAARLWSATLAAAAIANFLLTAGTALASVSRPATKWITAAAATKLVIVLVWSLSTDTFAPVVVDSLVTLAALAALQTLAWKRRRAASVPWILGGVAVSVVAAAIETLRPEFPPPFGPDAAYHLLQLGGLLLFLRGALAFDDGRMPPPENGDRPVS